MDWHFKQLQPKKVIHPFIFNDSRWKSAYLDMELRTAEMPAVLVLLSGLMAEVLSD